MSDARTPEALDRLEALAKESLEEATFGWNFTSEKDGDKAWTQFITAANPDTILALIGRVQALEDQREDLRGRMERARRAVLDLAVKSQPMQAARLTGKAEGISLCLDYLRGVSW